MFGVRRPRQRHAGDGSDGGDGSSPQGQRLPAGRVIGIGVAVAAVAVASIAAALTGNAAKGADHVQTAASTGRKQSGPIRLTVMAPSAGSTGVNGAQPVTITFSVPLADNTPVPILRPNVPGHWNVDGDSLVFQPAAAFAPLSRIAVEIPGGSQGVRSADGRVLSSSVTEHFTTGAYSNQRLAELLAQLGYLPMTWAAANSGATRAEDALVGTSSVSQAGLAYDPPPGNFQWKPGYPASLTSQWTAGTSNVILRGAIMAFQSQHGMTINGAVTSRLWDALFLAASADEQNVSGYSYAVASKHLPETLTIWHNGHIVFRSLTNTGIPISPTVDGTFPVYLRLRSQIMSGTNPDGSHYADPVAFVSYFNGGDAIHYFPRGSYGSEQSLGCVELPYAAAERAYPYMTYGSLVTVTG